MPESITLLWSTAGFQNHLVAKIMAFELTLKVKWGSNLLISVFRLVQLYFILASSLS